MANQWGHPLSSFGFAIRCSKALSWFDVERTVSSRPERGGGWFEGGLFDVEEGSCAFAAEDDASGIVVDFNGIVDCGAGQDIFHRFGLGELFADVDKDERTVFEELRFALHGSNLLSFRRNE